MTESQRADLLLRFEALIGHLSLRSATNYEDELLMALNRILGSFVSADDITDLARRREVSKVIIEELKPIYSNLGDTILEDMALIAGITNEVMSFVYEGSPVDKILKFNDRTLIHGVELKDLIKSNNQQSLVQFKRVIAQGLAQGQHTNQIVRELKKVTDKRVKHVSRLVVGDAIAEARGQASYETYKQLYKQGIVKGIMWLTRLEVGVCPICIPYSHKTWKTWNEMIHDTGGTKLHPNCKCTHIFLTGHEKGDKKYAGQKYFYTDSGRLSKSGAEFTNSNYATWLKQQPKAVRDIVNTKKRITQNDINELMKI